METLLTEWGFPDLVSVFEDDEIDEEALLCLDFQTLKELVPKIGPRMKFSAKLKQYRDQDVMNMSIVFDSNDLAPVSSSPLSLSNVNVINQVDLASPSSSTSTNISNEEAISDNIDEIANAFRISSSKQRAFCGKENLQRAFRTVYKLDLQQFLNRTVSGRFILNSYERDKRLSRKLRNQLTYILVNGLMSENRNKNLIPLDFDILSEKICQLFPNETMSTYYIPRVPGTKRTPPINAKGKLIDKYRNLKRSYNLFKEMTINNITDNQAQIPDINTDELRPIADWLKLYQEPWDMVLLNWQKTFPLRKLDAKSRTIEDFIGDWPILKHQNIHELIEYDFQQYFPECHIISLIKENQKWEQFYEGVKNLHKLDTSAEEFMAPLESRISQDSSNAIQIASLAMLFPPKGRIRCKKAHWKPSTIECQESIVNLVSTSGNIDEFILKRRAKLGSLNLTVQPYLIVIGAAFSSITECYLVIDNYKYKMFSVLQGFDLMFKALHTLNANYPKESEHIWLLIERALYKIESSTITIPAVLTALNELENL